MSTTVIKGGYNTARKSAGQTVAYTRTGESAKTFSLVPGLIENESEESASGFTLIRLDRAWFVLREEFQDADDGFGPGAEPLAGDTITDEDGVVWELRTDADGRVFERMDHLNVAWRLKTSKQ